MNQVVSRFAYLIRCKQSETSSEADQFDPKQSVINNLLDTPMPAGRRLKILRKDIVCDEPGVFPKNGRSRTDSYPSAE